MNAKCNFHHQNFCNQLNKKKCSGTLRKHKFSSILILGNENLESWLRVSKKRKFNSDMIQCTLLPSSSADGLAVQVLSPASLCWETCAVPVSDVCLVEIFVMSLGLGGGTFCCSQAHITSPGAPHAHAISGFYFGFPPLLLSLPHPAPTSPVPQLCPWIVFSWWPSAHRPGVEVSAHSQPSCRHDHVLWVLSLEVCLLRVTALLYPLPVRLSDMLSSFKLLSLYL